jgi:hypothetical protein
MNSVFFFNIFRMMAFSIKSIYFEFDFMRILFLLRRFQQFHDNSCVNIQLRIYAKLCGNVHMDINSLRLFVGIYWLLQINVGLAP